MPHPRLVAVLVVLLLGGAAAVGNAAEDPVRFLDGRPVVIDIDRYPAGTRFGVTVVVDGGATGSVVRADVVGDVGVTLDDGQGGLPLPVTAAEPARLVLTLRERTTGSGLLVVTTGESKVITRSVRTVRSSTLTPMPDHLELRGTRLVPFRDRVRVEPLALGFDPLAERGRCSSSVVEVGRLAGGREPGGVIVRDGCTLRVEGLDGPGTYEGRADLGTGEDGQVVSVAVLVRDAWGWPLLILVTGLAVVSWIDGFTRRHRPRRVLLGRLARLRRRAARASALHGVAVSADPLVRKESERALGQFDDAPTDADRQRWELGGDAHQELVALVDRYVELAERLHGLHDRSRRLVAGARPADQAGMRAALDASVVGSALRERELTTRAELRDAEGRATAAATHLAALTNTYDALRPVLDGGAALADRAGDLLRALLGPGSDPTTLEGEARALLREWHESRPSPPPPLAVLEPDVLQPVPAGADDQTPAAPPPAPPEPARSRRLRLAPLAAAVASVALVLLAVPTTLHMAAPDDQLAPDPTTTTTVPPGEVVGEAPVAVTALARAAPVVRQPGTGALVGAGLVAPVAIGAGLAGLLWWIVTTWQRRRGPDDELGAHPDDHERRLRTDDRRFALVTGLLVVGSGLSVLYVPNPTFGSVGDYLALFLWGAAFGEGVQLARRFVPAGLT